MGVQRHGQDPLPVAFGDEFDALYAPARERAPVGASRARLDRTVWFR
jgi:hypothetical protein